MNISVTTFSYFKLHLLRKPLKNYKNYSFLFYLCIFAHYVSFIWELLTLVIRIDFLVHKLIVGGVMNLTKSITTLVVLLLCQITFADVNLKQWVLSGGKAVGNEGRTYSSHFLRNRIHGRFLSYNNSNDLIWIRKVKGSSYTSNKSFDFRTLEGSKNQENSNFKSKVKYGELFAIWAPGSGSLKYTKMPRGINLKLYHRGNSHYQWKFTGGKTGDPIPNQDTPNPKVAVGLFNTVAKQHLVYCKRKWGISLRWAKDCKQSGRKKVIDHRKK